MATIDDFFDDEEARNRAGARGRRRPRRPSGGGPSGPDEPGGPGRQSRRRSNHGDAGYNLASNIAKTAGVVGAGALAAFGVYEALGYAPIIGDLVDSIAAPVAGGLASYATAARIYGRQKMDSIFEFGSKVYGVSHALAGAVLGTITAVGFDQGLLAPQNLYPSGLMEYASNLGPVALAAIPVGLAGLIIKAYDINLWRTTENSAESLANSNVQIGGFLSALGIGLAAGLATAFALNSQTDMDPSAVISTSRYAGGATSYLISNFMDRPGRWVAKGASYGAMVMPGGFDSGWSTAGSAATLACLELISIKLGLGSNKGPQKPAAPQKHH